MVKEIVVRNNPVTTGNDEYFPFVAESEGLSPTRGKTYDDAILNHILENLIVFDIRIKTDPNLRIPQTYRDQKGG